MLARPVLLILFTLAHSCFGCIRMVPTDPGIPATPKPLVCPKLEPADLEDCFNSGGVMCEAAVIQEPVIKCRNPSHKLHIVKTDGVWTYTDGTPIDVKAVACILYGG